MKRAWYCRDLKGSLADYVYLYVGYNPPTMNDGKWEESDDDGQKKTLMTALISCSEQLLSLN